MIIKVDLPPGISGTEQRVRLEVQQELRYKKLVDAAIWTSCDAPPPPVNGSRSREVLLIITDSNGDDLGHTVGYYDHKSGEWVWRFGAYNNVNTAEDGEKEGQVAPSQFQQFLFINDTFDIDPDFAE